ncbi:MAG: glycosyltransferase [Christiangramia sp.]
MRTKFPFEKLGTELNSYGKPLLTEHNHLQMVVTVPAKNEAKTIWKTLSALASQYLPEAPQPFKVFEVLVLCNHCNDDTRDLCILFQEIHPDFPLYVFETQDPFINTVGAARRVLMDIAAGRLPDYGFIITTDADTVPDKNWLHAILNTINDRADLICGIIKPALKGLNAKAANQLLQTRSYLDLVARLESELYPQKEDPWPRHSHNSGPNMAIRNLVYKKIGGIPPLPCLEDIALYQQVISHGFQVKHSSAPVVITSCRSSSRVVGGFGTQIKNWTASQTECVEGYEKLTERFTAYAEIRKYYQNQSSEILNSLSSRIYFEPSVIKSLIQNHVRSSSLIIHLEHILKNHVPWNSAYPNIPLDFAIEELENYFSTFSHTKSSYSSCR